jgi:hypothetical protein
MKVKEAEKLLGKWRFKEEVDNRQNYLSILVSIGYKIGQRWASNQNKGDLPSRFEEFYEDGNDDNLSNQRYEMLYEELDPSSIITELPDTLDQELDAPHVSFVFNKPVLFLESPAFLLTTG